MKALMRIYEKQREWLRSSRLEVGKLKQTLETLWQVLLRLKLHYVTFILKNRYICVGFFCWFCLHICLSCHYVVAA